jgi:outer membrane protein assembly factor BamD
MTKGPHIIIFILITCFMTGGIGSVPVYAGSAQAPSLISGAVAFWVWTPETNKWTNPKYAVKETPEEQLQFGIDFYKAKEYKEAVREFRKLIQHYPRARQAPDAQYHIGLCLEEQDRIYQAFKEYQEVIDKYPFSELATTIVKKQYDIGIRLLESVNSRSRFVEAFAGADYNVVDVFKAVIKNAPYGELAAPAQYKIGLYLQEKRLYQEARDEFEKVINDYPGNEWAKAAKYQIALADANRSTDAQYDQKITQAAVEEFKEFVENYPDAELSAKAKEQIRQLREKEAENNFVVAQFYEKQKNYKAAKIYYQVVVDDFANSSWASRALNKVREMNGKE